jgi:hypothetical protein
MSAIGRWFRHLFGAMMRGCLVLAALALAGAVGLVYEVTRALPTTGEWALIAALVVVAGALGAAIMLVWQLSHIDHLRALAHAREQHEKAR